MQKKLQMLAFDFFFIYVFLQLMRNSYSLICPDCFSVMSFCIHLHGSAVTYSTDLLQLLLALFLCVCERNGSDKVQCIWQVALTFEIQFSVKGTQPSVVGIRELG